MATIDITASSCSKETANKNFLKPNSFKMVFSRLPNVEFFCQSANIPKLTLGVSTQPTPFVDIPHVGDKLVFDPLNIVFIIDEDMENFRELYSWLVGLGFPKSHAQFTALTKSKSTNVSDSSLEESNIYSDASLFILNNNNMPTLEVKFYECFPVSVESLDFDLRIPTVDYFTGIASFKYKLYEIVPLGTPYSDML